MNLIITFKDTMCLLTASVDLILQFGWHCRGLYLFAFSGIFLQLEWFLWQFRHLAIGPSDGLFDASNESYVLVKKHLECNNLLHVRSFEVDQMTLCNFNSFHENVLTSKQLSVEVKWTQHWLVCRRACVTQTIARIKQTIARADRKIPKLQ